MSSLLIALVLLAGIPFQAALAVSDAETALTTLTPSILGGNKVTVRQSIANVTDTVYQQVYAYEALFTFDTDEYNYSAVTSGKTTLNNPQAAMIAPGKYKVTTEVSNTSSPESLAGSSTNFINFALESKTTVQTINTTITASDIYITNQQGDKLKLEDASVVVTVGPAGDKTQLRALLDQIETAKPREGIWNGQYPAGTMSSFMSTLISAKSMVNSGAFTQAAIDTQYTALYNAYQALLPSVITNNSVPTLPDGEYNIDFSIYKYGTNDVSIMQSYLDPTSGILHVEGNKQYFSFTLNQHKEILSLKSKQNGALVETDIPSIDVANNKRIVKFEVPDIAKHLDGWVKIYWQLTPDFLYDSEYDIEYGFGAIGIANKAELNAGISSAKANYDAAVVGTDAGQYSESAKAALLTAITTAQGVAVNAAAAQQETDDAVAALEAAVQAFKSSVVLGEGTYPISFMMYKAGTDEKSVMYDYVNQASGKLSIRDGKKYVSFTLNQSKEILSFKTKLNSNEPLAETAIIASDETANTRTVEFEVEDLSSKIDAWVKIYWVITEGFIYDHEYDVQVAVTGVTIPSAGDAAALVALIADAQAKHDAAVEGTATGEYPAGAKAALLTAIAAAQSVADDTNATQEQMDQAAAALQAAITSLTGSVIGAVSKATLTTSPATVYGGNRVSIQNRIISVSDSAFQQVHGYEATFTFDPELLTMSTINRNTKYNIPVATELSPGVVKMTTGVLDSENPIDLTVDYADVLPFYMSTKTTTTEKSTSIKVSDMWVINKEGNRHQIDGELSAAVKIIPGGDKTQLKALITRIDEEQMREGVWNGQYPAGALTAMNRALNQAKTTANGSETAQATIDLRYSALLAAYDAAKLTIITNNPLPTLADGQYPIDFTVFKDGTNEVSFMHQFVDEESAKLHVEGDKTFVTFTLKQHTENLSLKTLQNGTLVETEILSVDTVHNTRVVKFEVADLSKRLNAWIKVYWDLGPPLGIYDYEYDIEFGFGAITTAGGSTDSSGGKKNRSKSSGSASSTASAPAVTLADGKYNVTYTLLSTGTGEQSALQQHIDGAALLAVDGDKNYVTLRLKDSSEISSLKVVQNGVETEVKVVSENQAEGTREIQFEVASLASKVKITANIGGEEVVAELLLAAADAQEVIDDEQPTDETPAEPADTTESPSIQPVKDVQRHWAKEYVERAVSLGIVNGYEDGTFRPDDEISRAEFTVLISRVLQLEDTGSALNYSDLSLVPDWAKSDLAKVAAAGMISSYEDNTFRADRSITRSEIAVIVARALNLQLDDADSLNFADEQAVPPWAYAHVAAAYSKGIMNGRDNNQFAPAANATRAEAIKLILALLDAK
ncbi:NEAT domain-containing protein [Paenibacillus sp. y28]